VTAPCRRGALSLSLVIIALFIVQRLLQSGNGLLYCMSVTSTACCSLCRVKGSYGVPLQYERSFRWKLGQFRYLCQSNSLQGHVKINVSRETLFEDSYNQLSRLQPFDLRRRLYIIFRGEEGLDYGGVARYVVMSVAVATVYMYVRM
jgi:hypothetical protein